MNPQTTIIQEIIQHRKDIKELQIQIQKEEEQLYKKTCIMRNQLEKLFPNQDPTNTLTLEITNTNPFNVTSMITGRYMLTREILEQIPYHYTIILDSQSALMINMEKIINEEDYEQES